VGTRGWVSQGKVRVGEVTPRGKINRGRTWKVNSGLGQSVSPERGERGHGDSIGPGKSD